MITGKYFNNKDKNKKAFINNKQNKNILRNQNLKNDKFLLGK